MSTASLIPLPIPSESLRDAAVFAQLRLAVLNGVTAKNSKRNYALALDELAAFSKQRPQPISRALLLDFRAGLIDKNLKPSTINVKLSAIRSLVDGAKRAGILSARKPRT